MGFNFFIFFYIMYTYSHAFKAHVTNIYKIYSTTVCKFLFLLIHKYNLSEITSQRTVIHILPCTWSQKKYGSLNGIP